MKRARTKMKKGISIRWKLLMYMTVFVAVVLLVTWFFQIFLLGNFYRYVKKQEMKESSELIVQNLESDSLPTVARHTAVDHSLFVTVFKIENGNAENVAIADATGKGVPGALSNQHLVRFYQKAKESGGSYYSRLAFGNVEFPEEGFFDQLPFVKGKEEQKISPNNMRMLYVSVAEGASGSEYLILLDTSLQPFDTTVYTLTRQYLWIVIIILIAAVTMALILYRKISAPLIHMTQAAKKLSQGEYDANFSVNGYRETRELADTLNYAANELAKADRMQKELIANVSHDLRTPLTLIKGYSEVMRDLPDENTPENMQVIIDEATRLSDLVNDLLDLSRMQAGARPMTPERFELSQTVRDVVGRYDALLQHRGYRMEFLTDGTAWICADHSMILQVLYNLINNAINYSGNEKNIVIQQTRAENKVRISVTDSGDGIASEELPLIWDRYYKVDKVHKRAMVGTGIGLSIVKEILEIHKAEYGVESHIGVGTTFWFELYLTEEP